MRRLLLPPLLALAAISCGPKKAATGGEENAADADWYGNPSAASANAGGTRASGPAPAALPPAGLTCGEVRLSGDVASALPADFVNWWVLIYAHTGGPEGPVLAAAKGHVPPHFPLRFCIGPKNVVVPGAALAGPLWIGARLDDEGGPDLAPGDFDGIAKTPSPAGARDVVVTIDTFR